MFKNLSRKELTMTATVGLPSIVALVLSLVAGALQVVNQVVMNYSTEWHTYVSVIIIMISSMGVSPLVGSKFRSALHLPAVVSLIAGGLLSALTLAISAVPMSTLALSIITAGVTILTGLGFAPSTSNDSTPATAQA